MDNTTVSETQPATQEYNMDNSSKLTLLKREYESIRQTIQKMTADAEQIITSRISFELVAAAIEHEMDAIRNLDSQQLEFELVD